MVLSPRRLHHWETGLGLSDDKRKFMISKIWKVVRLEEYWREKNRFLPFTTLGLRVTEVMIIINENLQCR